MRPDELSSAELRAGAGVALEAQLRGLKVACVEQAGQSWAPAVRGRLAGNVVARAVLVV